MGIVSLSATWANGGYMKAYFGVDAEQSAASGLDMYSTDSGLRDISLSIIVNYRFNNRWSLALGFSHEWLQGDARDSPVVDKAEQSSLFATVSYGY